MQAEKWIKRVSPWVLIAAMAGSSGCAFVAGTAVGVGALAYAKGDVRETIAATVERLTPAVERALADQKIAIRKTTIRPKGVTYSAFVEDPAGSTLTAPSRRVTIDLVSVGDETTQVTVRAGTIGDEVRGRGILDAIKKNLN